MLPAANIFNGKYTDKQMVGVCVANDNRSLSPLKPGPNSLAAAVICFASMAFNEQKMVFTNIYQHHHFGRLMELRRKNLCSVPSIRHRSHTHTHQILNPTIPCVCVQHLVLFHGFVFYFYHFFYQEQRQKSHKNENYLCSNKEQLKNYKRNRCT